MLPFWVRGLRTLLLVAILPLASDSVLAQTDTSVDVTAQLGHSSTVRTVSFSPDGRQLVSAGWDSSAKLWDVASGRLIRTFIGHTATIGLIAFSPAGQQLASSGQDKTIRLWNVQSGRLMRTIALSRVEDRYEASIAYSPDGRSLASCCATSNHQSYVQLWDIASGSLIRNFEGGDGFGDLAFSPTGRHIAMGTWDHTVKLWDAASGKLTRTFAAHSAPVDGVAFSPDGRRLASISRDKSTKIWDAQTGRLLRTLKRRADLDDGGSVVFSPDGSKLATSGMNKLIELWDVATGQHLRAFEDGYGDVAFSPDSRRIAAAVSGNAIGLWDLDNGRRVLTLDGATQPVTSVAFASDGKQVASGGEDKTITLWDAASGRVLFTLVGHADAVASVAFSPRGDQLASGSADKVLKIWETSTGQLLRTSEGHTQPIGSVGFSRDGRFVATGSARDSDSRNRLRLWDVATGRFLLPLQEGGGWGGLAFLPGSPRVVSTLDTFDQAGNRRGNRLGLWDAASGRLLRTFDGHSSLVVSIALSSDGHHLASSSLGDGDLLEINRPGGKWRYSPKLWSVDTGTLLRTFEGHSSPVFALAFSPNGRYLASGGSDRTIRIQDVTSGRSLGNLQGHTSTINALGFSPDGRTLLSGSADGTVRFWSVEDGREFVRLISDPRGNWLALSHDGFFDAKGNVDGFAHLVRGMEVVSIGQVHQSLYNPDLVREALAGDASGEVRDAAKVINLAKVVGSGPPPTVLIRAPPHTASDVVSVEARVSDGGKGVGRIEWRVNGITAAVDSKPPGGGPTYFVTRQLALDLGDNAIEVVAYNSSNLLASAPARATSMFKGPADKANAKLHILAIGIDDYDGFSSLGLAVKDATAFAAKMTQAAAGLYEMVHVTLALNRDATRDKLRKVIEKLAAEIHARDSFILFAAGHGVSENGRFYLIPQDYQRAHGPLARGAIGHDDLQDWFANRIKAKKAIILIDTCESGALVAGHARSRTDAPSSEAAIGRLHEATGRPVLTAAALGQFAHEGVVGASGERHGVFTWAVLDALRKGDTNGNGLIELSELVRHVQDTVPKISATLGGVGRATLSEPIFGKQAPRFGSRGEDFAVAQRLQ